MDTFAEALLVSLFEDCDSVEKWVKPVMSLYLGRSITVLTARGLDSLSIGLSLDCAANIIQALLPGAVVDEFWRLVSVCRNILKNDTFIYIK